jgi:hypothetical protein
MIDNPKPILLNSAEPRGHPLTPRLITELHGNDSLQDKLFLSPKIPVFKHPSPC